MKLTNILLATSLLTGAANAGDFIDYKKLTKGFKSEFKKSGNYATTTEVKKALKAKDWIVADVRTVNEWAGAHIKGSQRIGRQAPEKALGNFVTDDTGKFIKDNIIVVCNSAARASLEAQIFKKMGFKTVKIYDIYSWIDECNPVKTSYTVKKDKGGTGLKFGMFYAQHCKK
ncbi:MAG: rhodanese-like domain-containing protein [Arcobacteraceae bacterium]|nr:rhodanese-like domain-containing protein [Arcobacteraceae bacterium]